MRGSSVVGKLDWAIIALLALSTTVIVTALIVLF